MLQLQKHPGHYRAFPAWLYATMAKVVFPAYGGVSFHKKTNPKAILTLYEMRKHCSIPHVPTRIRDLR
jgi:hypothetical protein